MIGSQQWDSRLQVSNANILWARKFQAGFQANWIQQQHFIIELFNYSGPPCPILENPFFSNFNIMCDTYHLIVL